MNLSLWIARKLNLRTDGGSSVGVGIAVAGVAIAIVIMEFTLAIVVGFKTGITDKLIGFDAQISVLPPTVDGAETITKTPVLTEAIDEITPNAEISLAVRHPGLLKTDSDFQGVVYLAADPTSSFSFEKSIITQGVWPDYSQDSCRNSIVISESNASALNLNVGDKVYSTYFIDGNIKMRRHTIAGLFRSNFGEYDKTVVFASLSGMQSVLGIDSLSGTRLDIRGIGIGDIPTTASRLHSGLLDGYISHKLEYFYPVDDVTRSGAMYFNWLSLLDTNVVIIFILMLCVAGLTLVSSLFILILERVRTIGILRAMGADKLLVRRIFIQLAMRLVGRGMIIGNIIGIGCLLIQKYLHLIPLNPEMYYLDYVPVVIQPWAIVALNIGVVICTWLILVLPARLASNIDPAKSMKYD